jgi:hypothetical protein
MVHVKMYQDKLELLEEVGIQYLMVHLEPSIELEELATLQVYFIFSHEET